MLVERIFDSDLAHAAWMIGCQKTRQALIIDPARDIDRYLSVAQSAKLRIAAVTETHIHADFLSGSEELSAVTGATCYLSKEGGSDWSYTWPSKSSADVKLVGDGDKLSVGSIEITVIHTPGHTPEHICFLVREAGSNEPIGIASGDFVFVGDLGRPDLLETAAGIEGSMEASAKELYKSCQDFILMDDYLQVWPAHGAGSACGKSLSAVPQSTVGYEKRTSPPLQRIKDEASFIDFMLTDQPEPPRYFAMMKRLNRDGVKMLGGIPQPNEISNPEELLELSKGKTIIDTRDWSDVRDGHLKGSIWARANGEFHRFAGSFVEASEEIIFIVRQENLSRAIRNAIRIGLDHIVGYATPETLARVPGLEVMPEVDAASIDAKSEEINILDVRKQSEFKNGAIPSAINCSHTKVLNQLDEIDQSTPWIVNCQGGTRSAAACMALRRQGYDVTNLAGGYRGWLTFDSQTTVSQ